MDVNSFLQFFNGIYCDFDGAEGDQCFDLANAYSRWIGGFRFTGATADLIFNQTQNGFYTQIPNTIDGVPQKGDIVVFNWPHVGIATGNNSDTRQFEVLEQNDPLNSNCHIKLYTNYNGVIGWLRPVNIPNNEDLQKQLSQSNADRDLNWVCFNIVMNAIPEVADPNNKLISANKAASDIANLKVKVSTIAPQPPNGNSTISTNPNQVPTTAISTSPLNIKQNPPVLDGSTNNPSRSSNTASWITHFIRWFIGK